METIKKSKYAPKIARQKKGLFSKNSPFQLPNDPIYVCGFCGQSHPMSLHRLNELRFKTKAPKPN